MQPSRRPLLLFILLPSAFCLLTLPSCTTNTDPTPSPTTRTSDAALKDPFGKWSGDVNTNISGGDIGNFDSKALKRDSDNFWLK